MRFDHPYLIAFGAMALFLVLYRLLSGVWNPLAVVRGEDGRPSTSKLQFWLWTVVALFSYVALYAARLGTDSFDPIESFPQSLLIAMGLSAATSVAAKGITVAQLQSGSLTKTDARGPAQASQVLTDDSGSLDLSKIQMLAWTLVAIVVYLITACHAINQHILDKLPDIDSALMVLMGLGQAAYLGKKVVTTDTPSGPAGGGGGGGDVNNVPVVGDTQVSARAALVERRPANSAADARVLVEPRRTEEKVPVRAGIVEE